jgi:uncharacterized protein (TIGR03083 family)
MAMKDDDLATMALALDAVSVALPSPPDARERVLAAARAARAPGGDAALPPIGAIESYRRTVAAMDALLATLDGAGWRRTVEPYGWTVQGLVGHLVAVDRYVATLLGADQLPFDPALESDHRAMTLPWVEAQQGRPPEATLDDWRSATATVLAALDALAPTVLDDDVSFHGITLRRSSLLVLRTFEIWTHDEDVRRSAGLPLAAPEPARLALMSGLAVRALPLGLLLTGQTAVGRTARIVLTGAGGGSWLQPLGLDEVAGEPEVCIVADVVDFCRLAAQRLAADAIDVDVEGDRGLAGAVLVGAAVFAA